MISKISQIRGIGKFKNFRPGQPIEFDKVTVIYGENGQGKSSLAMLLRSLTDGGERRLGDRKTLGNDRQSAVLELADGTYLGYASPGRGWKPNDLDVLVFDEIFIGENVYSGVNVNKEHKRNLPTLILGKDEIALVKEEQRVKRSIDDRNAKLRTLRSKITEKIEQPDDTFGSPPDVDRFIAQDPIPNLEELISAQERLIGPLTSSSRYLNGELFSELVLPELPLDKLATLLNSTIEDIESSAFERVQNHLECFESTHLESWIERGTEFTSSSEICPYCGRTLEGSDLVKLYQDYFSKEYKQLLSNVRGFATEFLTRERTMDVINSSVASNQSLIPFWSEAIDELRTPEIEFDPIRIAFSNLKEEVKELLGEKSNRPLEAIAISEKLKAHLKHWNSIRISVDRYNARYIENNLAITDHKETLKSSDLDFAKQELIRLNNAKLRFSDEMIKLCDEYQSQNESLEKENSEKERLQAAIKEVNDRIDETFVCGLNGYLRRLNAGFSISKVKVRPDGTEWQLDYCISLMDEHIPVGGNQALKSGQSYKSVLSEGDRRTLALALFMASLDRNASLENAIIVYDDPVTSMDDNRSSATADMILEICEEACQVIVMSHRKRFLHNFWIKYERGHNRYGDVCLHEVCPCEDENAVEFSEIRPNWNIRRAIETEFEEHVRYLVDYIRNASHTDKLNAASKLRVVLETHYQSLYQDEFADGSKQFGDFIGKVLGCTENSRLYPLKKQDGPELRRLNEATSTFHHPASLVLEETELKALCKDTLNLIGRRY